MAAELRRQLSGHSVPGLRHDARVLADLTLDLATAIGSHGVMSGAPVRPGDVLAGKYQVEKILGQGNMGVVVAATHVTLGQTVALKFLLPGQHVGREQLERFIREGRAAVRLKSQHVTRVLDVGMLDDGAPYTVMEYLEGRDLKAILVERGPLPIGDAIEYVLQACEAIGEAHAAGVIHRDIKPANLFLTTDASRMPCVKIFDFGISKLVGDLTLTKEQQSMGSPLYMSPEQLNASKDVDGRSDLWSLGATLYELLAGQTPFHAQTMEQLCFRIFTGQATPLSELRKDVPPGLEMVITQCLQKDRNLRFKNVAELAAALAPWAPPRAAAYPERVARVLDVHTEPARSTDLLPSAPASRATPLPAVSHIANPAPTAASSATGSSGGAASAARAPLTSNPAGITQDMALAVSNLRQGRMASPAKGPATRRGPPLRVIAVGLLVVLAVPVSMALAVRALVPRNGPVADASGTAFPAAATSPGTSSLGVAAVAASASAAQTPSATVTPPTASSWPPASLPAAPPRKPTATPQPSSTPPRKSKADPYNPLTDM